jgi:multidrug resistance efflux pump
MADPGEGQRAEVSEGSSAAGEPGRVAFLDLALWKQFREATTREEFARSWLALQCRMLDGVGRGVVLWGDADTGSFQAVANWPDGENGTHALHAAAELAVKERRGVVRGRRQSDAEDRQNCEVSYPFLFNNQVHGAVSIEVQDRTAAELRSIMRDLQWGVAGVEAFMHRRQGVTGTEFRERVEATLDSVAATIDKEEFRPACDAVVTELATRLECDRVSVGFLKRGHATVFALSHSAQFGKRMKLIRKIGAAMDEALDQGMVVAYPADQESGFQVTRSHAELIEAHGAGSVITVPFEVQERLLGAFTFEWPAGKDIDQGTIECCELIASLVGPILDEKRRNSRLIIFKLFDSCFTQVKRLVGPRYIGRKMVCGAAVLLALGFYFAYDTYRVTAPARLEGLVQRVVVAPYDGYVRSEHKRAGDTVKRGEILATLDDRELSLQHFREVMKRNQHRKEYDRALADRKRADANIIKAQIEQASAQIALFSDQLLRAKFTAPFDGIVVSGDLSQSVGAPVQRGDVLYEIAPLNKYRLILEVDESEISQIRIEQPGALLLSALPGETLPLVVKKTTPVSEARDGRNYFRVEAQLVEGSDHLRPGMEGVAKISIDRRRLIWIWTHKLFDWLRLWTWSWWP